MSAQAFIDVSQRTPVPRATRVLFLDDSGKPSRADGTKAVVIGGFSIPSENVPSLSRKIAGAKSRFFPNPDRSRVLVSGLGVRVLVWFRGWGFGVGLRVGCIWLRATGSEFFQAASGRVGACWGASGQGGS